MSLSMTIAETEYLKQSIKNNDLHTNTTCRSDPVFITRTYIRMLGRRTIPMITRVR